MDQHFDAERLAAFADGSLSPAERAAAEAHAADCPRCLQLLAAMARTEPPAVPAGWRLPVIVRWAVPMAAAATALAVWVNVARDRRGDDAAPPSAVAVALPPVTAPATPVPPAREPQPSQPPSAATDALSKSVLDRQRKSEGAATPGETRQSARAKERADAPAREEGTSAALEARKTDRRAAPPPPTAAVPAPPTPSAVAETLGSQAADSAAGSRFARQAFATLEIVSPEPLVRWRVRGLLIERSTDGGKTWVTTGEVLHTTFVAGSSPSPNVAWLAGRGGSLLRTIDGNKWQRLEFPETVDLTGIRALSDREAEVTTADGRVFRTSDGGRTWSVQETPRSSF
jgi:photosynthesis system II assembly factor YCF48-like protein/putative zinc finger protein